MLLLAFMLWLAVMLFLLLRMRFFCCCRIPADAMVLLLLLAILLFLLLLVTLLLVLPCSSWKSAAVFFLWPREYGFLKLFSSLQGTLEHWRITLEYRGLHDPIKDHHGGQWPSSLQHKTL
jgi:hypothetical protein